MESGTTNREQGEEQAEAWWKGEHADGWWKDEQTGSSSSSGWWMTPTDQTLSEPEGPVGAIEINSVEQTYIKHDRWRQEWLRVNSDSGAVVTALFVAVAGDLLLEKRGEVRVASGAVIPNLRKIKMKSTDESGVARSIRGHITEVAKPLLSAAEVSRRWDSLLFVDGGIFLERNCLVALKIRAILKKTQGLESSWQEHQILPRRQLVQCVRASWRCHTRTCFGRTSRGEVDQDRSGRRRA